MSPQHKTILWNTARGWAPWAIIFTMLTVAMLFFVRVAGAQPSEPVPIPTDSEIVIASTEVAPDGLSDGVERIETGKEVDWAVTTLGALKAAADERKWGPFASIVIMAILSALSALLLRSEEFRDKVKPYMGEIAIASTVLIYLAGGAATLPAGATVGEWWGVIAPALKTGFAASGAYQFLVKRLLKTYGPKLLAWIRGWLSKKAKS